ncbi:MAG: PDZ domain-containing protein [Actinobacteria bacterium]|nr:MAG: PDZ domain-containing protein [Actinomycetota bacterium]
MGPTEPGQPAEPGEPVAESDAGLRDGTPVGTPEQGAEPAATPPPPASTPPSPPPGPTPPPPAYGPPPGPSYGGYGPGQTPYWTPPAGPEGQPGTGAPYGSPYGTAPYGTPLYGAPPYGGPPPVGPKPPKRFSQRLLPWSKGLLAAAALLVAVFVVANALGAFRDTTTTLPSGTGASLRTAATTPPTGTAPSLDTRSVLRAVEPGVVMISTSASGTFGGTTQGEGSGMVLDTQGNVITNAHVVSGSTTVSVQVFGQSTVYQAKVLGTDAADDIAVIQIQNPGPLTPVKIGKSSGLQVGDPVVAVGNALGLAPGGPSVTTGIISGLNRSLQTSGERLAGLIQTDAAINPGNSGGPLADASGQVIGMNTAVSNNGEGVAFAIPIDRITPLIDSLKKGTVTTTGRGFLGVQITAAQAGGAQITAVTPNSPAAGAGLKAGDVIVAIDDQPVATNADAADTIGSLSPGTKVRIKYQRGSSTNTVPVTLAATPASATG